MTTEARARRRAETEARQANQRADKLLDDRNDALRRVARLQADLAAAEKTIAALEAALEAALFGHRDVIHCLQCGAKRGEPHGTRIYDEPCPGHALAAYRQSHPEVQP